MTNDPAIKTSQFAHQRELYLKHRDDEYFALLWEMGLGKTKVTLDVASHHYHQGNIDALIIIAPNSVYKNWIHEEAPKHLAAPYIGMVYPKASNERGKLKRTIFLDPTFEKSKLRVLSISYDSMITPKGFKYLESLLKIYKCMIVADESTAFKKPLSNRAKSIKKLGKLAEYRWLCTGTPATESPFDLHSQIEFLDPEFWSYYGVASLGAFKSEFGVFKVRKVGKRRFKQITSYRRLETLNRIIQPISSRLLKEDSQVELPPKTYTTRSFELSDVQRKLYNEVKKDFVAAFEDGGIIEVPLAIARLSRLQQITSGFVSKEYETETKIDFESDGFDMFSQLKSVDKERRVDDIIHPDDNPRLKLLLAIINECRHKVIVWTRFRRDVEIITSALAQECVRYDGSVSGKDREIALARFKDPSDPAKVFVANTHAISMGVTLTIAKTMIYYSNSHSLEKRLQSEDRNHRVGQDSPVTIVDLVAEDTIDEHIRDNLRNKYDIAAIVTGDKLREWIQA